MTFEVEFWDFYLKMFSQLWKVSSWKCNVIFYKGKIVKTNQSEFWNLLSYREVCLTFSKVRNLKIQTWLLFDLNISKGPRDKFKKLSWDNSVSPIDAKNSCRVQVFWTILFRVRLKFLVVVCRECTGGLAFWPLWVAIWWAPQGDP